MKIRQLQRKKKNRESESGQRSWNIWSLKFVRIRNNIVQGNDKRGLPLHSSGQNAMSLLLHKLK